MSGIDFQDDKMHEECGVFGIYSHNDDVALNTYWGLYALQHRGQESCGIVATDGTHMEGHHRFQHGIQHSAAACLF